MLLTTLDSNFLERDIVDKFESAIWTDRYYGDGEVKLTVEPTRKMIDMLAEGTFLKKEGSDQPMILETQEFEDGKMKVSGITLTKWLNNRFIRTSPNHEDRYWNLSGMTPGQILTHIVEQMCTAISPYLDGTIDTGITNPQKFVVPGLMTNLADSSDKFINVAVPFGPVYDALKEIATTYQIGMKTTIISASSFGYILGFSSYKGSNKTVQGSTAPVRFTPDMNSLTDIKELRSIADFKTEAYVFAPSNPGELADEPGFDSLVTLGGGASGFGLRTVMIFAEDLTTDMIGGSAAVLQEILNTRATDALSNSAAVRIVEGEIVKDAQFEYGTHYKLGDIIELQGYTGTVQQVRVTEYIHTKDATGERAYPTVSIIDN